MNAARAKRRWMRWQRYVIATGTIATNQYSAGMHNGYTRAHWDAASAGRYAPNGIRDTWQLRPDWRRT